MSGLKKQAEEIVYCLRTGEVAYAYHLYPAFLNDLVSYLPEAKMLSLSPLLSEMLKAQSTQNTVWMADLIEYILADSLC